jgi:cbb3-type cytochrome oxidase maturation protein
VLEYLTLGEFLVAVLMGAAALCAFVWGVATGAFRDVEGTKGRLVDIEREHDSRA